MRKLSEALKEVKEIINTAILAKDYKNSDEFVKAVVAIEIDGITFIVDTLTGFGKLNLKPIYPSDFFTIDDAVQEKLFKQIGSEVDKRLYWKKQKQLEKAEECKQDEIFKIKNAQARLKHFSSNAKSLKNEIESLSKMNGEPR